MAETTPVFQALTRAPTLLGLPYSYGIVWMAGCALPVIWAMSLATALFCGVAYVVLRLLAERDDKFFECLMVAQKAAPPTPSRRVFGGDSYAP